MELRSIFGVPAHPLIVHGAVVLLPLAAIGVLLVALVPKFRRIGAPIVLGLAVISAGCVFLAEQSGEVLERQVKENAAVEAHTEAADAVLPWAVLVVLAAGAVVVADPLKKKLPKVSTKAITGGLVALALVSGAGATASIVSVGHSGAKAVWGKTASKATTGEGGEGREGGEGEDDDG